ncbi:hypothetical protein GGS26DRAFT_306501 [Hypomontagnella submonticulosa]|nr:hypothetical protein GGS26DRAFT_306501 [Hypomontagnella submonticulosa]
MSDHDELFSPADEDYDPLDEMDSPEPGPSTNNVESEDTSIIDEPALVESIERPQEPEIQEQPEQLQEQEPEPEPEQEEQEQEQEPQQQADPDPIAGTKRKIDNISTGDDAEDTSSPEQAAEPETSIHVNPSPQQERSKEPTPAPAPAPEPTTEKAPDSDEDEDEEEPTIPEPYSPWRSTPISRLSLMDLLSISGTTLNFLINTQGKSIDLDDASTVRSALSSVADVRTVDLETPAEEAQGNAEAMVEKLLDMSVRDFVRLSHDVVSFKEDLDERGIRIMR